MVSSDDDTLRAEITRAKLIEALVKIEYGARLAAIGLLSTSAQLLTSAINDLEWVLGSAKTRSCDVVCVEKPSRQQVSAMLKEALKLVRAAEARARPRGPAAKVYALMRSRLRLEIRRALASLREDEETSL